MNEDSRAEDERDRQMARRMIEESSRVIEELQAKFDAIISPAERARLNAEYLRRMAEDEEFRNAMETLSPEEMREAGDHVLKMLEDNREELAGVDFDGKNVDEAIAMLRTKTEWSDKTAALQDEVADYCYNAQAIMAQTRTRLLVHAARLLQRLESLTEEQLAQFSPEDRLEIADLIAQWHNGEREACLSQLPIELRRQFE